MIVTVLIDLLKANLAAAVAVLVVALLRKPVRARLGARAAYGLWLAPLLVAAAVLAPHPAGHEAAAEPVVLAPIVIQAQAVTDEVVAAATPPHGADLPALLLGGWIAGGLAAAGVLARRQARFLASLGRLTPRPERGLWQAERASVGPAVVGVLKPKVVAPADFDARFAPHERALILAHEGAHLAGRDALANAAACLMQCLCWFNPLVHLAARLMRVDQEPACDATVVGRFPEQRRAYAELLLKTQLFTQPLPFGCHWPADGEHPLKERIAMLKAPLPVRSAHRLGAAAVLVACAGAAGLAWASSPPAAMTSSPGASERLAAQAAAKRRPNYSCDAAIELSGGGCKIIRVQEWDAIPTHVDLMRHYPPAALQAGVTALVRINCGLSADGRLKDCMPVETKLRRSDGAEIDHIGYGQQFAKAALELSGYYQWRMPQGRGSGARASGGEHASLGIWFSPNPDSPALPPPPGSVPALATSVEPASAPRAQVSRDSVKTAGPKVRIPVVKASTQASPPSVITMPDWMNRPTGEDLVGAYPRAALAAGLGGKATIACVTTAEGLLSGCQVMQEDPPGAGFGEAALQLSTHFKMRPMTKDGHPIAGGYVRIPIRFMVPTPPPAPKS